MEPGYRGRPNSLLRHQRLLRGWSLQYVADQLYKMGETEERLPGVNADMVGKWERGEKKPSPFYREKLCLLYGKSADQLGFIESEDTPGQSSSLNPLPSHSNNDLPSSSGAIAIPGFSNTTQIVDALLSGEKEVSETLAAHLLSLSSRQLAILTSVGWTQQDVMAAVQVLLQGEAIMAKITRRQVFQMGAGLVLSSIALPTHEHPTVEERVQLSESLGESIAKAWTLVQTASTAQVLAVGKAQLSLIQQAHYTLYPSVRPMHYSATYRLIGAALHFQGRYDEARQAHKNAYVAALEGGEAWNMAQSLTWQADGLKAQGQYTDAIQTIDAALRLVSQQKDIESIRLQAHLHASGAEIAAYMREAEGVQARLNASQALLENLPVHEEFDRTSWLQHAGACALILDQYDVAVRHLQQALDELPSHWTLRYATTLMPLVIALARSRQREACLAVAEKAIPIISAINAPSMNRQFVEYIQQEVLGAFPGDPQMSALASDAQQRLLPMKATASNS